MTISNAYTPASYTANGSAAETFDIPFPFAANSEIVLLEAGVVQTQGTIYTVTGAGLSTGGTATYVGTPTAAAAILINRVVPLVQDVNLQETGAFSAESVEGGLDTQVQQVQQSMQRNTTDGNTFDAETLKIVNVVDPTASQDAATKTYVDTAISSTGNVPAPITADIGSHLEATAAGAFGWGVTEEVPTPVAGDVTAERVLQATTAGVNGSTYQEVPARGGRARNMLMNGQFSVAQNGTTFTAATVPVNSTDTLLLDRWHYVANVADCVDVSQDTGLGNASLPEGAAHSMKSLVTAAGAADKFGFLQIIEHKDTVLAFENQNGSVSVSFEAFTNTGSAITNLRVGIMSWTGTVDSATSAIVAPGAWGAAGTNPTLATNWLFENTPANLALTANAWTTFTVTNVPLDLNGIQNIGLFIWVDDTDSVATDELYLGNVQMVIGSVVGQYGFRPFAEELALCQRYLQVFATGDADDPFCMGLNITDTTHSTFIMPLMGTMRTTPTLVVGSAGSDFDVTGSDGVDVASAIVIATATPNIAMLTVTHTAVTANVPLLLEAVSSAAKLTFSAEM